MSLRRFLPPFHISRNWLPRKEADAHVWPLGLRIQTTRRLQERPPTAHGLFYLAGRWSNQSTAFRIEDVPASLEILADDFVAHNFNLRRLLSTIAATQAFRRDSKTADVDTELTEIHVQHWAAFPITRFRPEQVAGGMLQAASLETINREDNILQRAIRFFGEREFVERYGDTGCR